MSTLPFSDFLSNLQTSEDAEKLTEELQTLSSSLYKTGKRSFENILKTDIRKTTAQALGKLLENNQITKDQRRPIQTLLAQIESSIASMQKVEIIISFEPTESFLTRLHTFLQDSFSKPVLLSLKTDSRIIGGAISIQNGLYRDFSLKKKIDSFFENQKETILRMF